MADKAFEADDPMVLVGTSVPLPPGTDGDQVVGLAIVEEYALMGAPPSRIWELFEDPEYTGTHSILARRGAEFCKSLIETVFGTDALHDLETCRRRNIPVRAASTGGSRNG